MAVLTTAARDKLPPSQFALPNGAYPVPDAAHAKAALFRVSQFGTAAEKAAVRRKVKAKFPAVHQEHMQAMANDQTMNAMLRGGR